MTSGDLHKQNLTLFFVWCWLKITDQHNKANARAKKWAAENPDRVIINKRKHYEENIVEICARSAAWRKDNRLQYNEALRNWRANNRMARNAWLKEWRLLQRNTNPQYAIASACRTRLRDALRGSNKSESTLSIHGVFSWDELRKKIEATFKSGFSWANHGTIWHLDHKRPCASFDLTDFTQLKQCFHWSNLEAISVAENLSKGAKWNPEEK
jgi:hypothetical protein